MRRTSSDNHGSQRAGRSAPAAETLPATPTDCLYYLLSRATLVATSILRSQLAKVAGARVQPAYLGVLMCLWNGDGLRTSSLARGAGLEPSTMTGLLDRMEADGWILRRPDPADRRAQCIWLTGEGRNLRQPVLEVVASVLSQATAGMSGQQIESTREVLRLLLANMQAKKKESRT